MTPKRLPSEPVGAICLSCANIVEEPLELSPVCAECGLRVDPERYRRLLSYSERVVRFGYQYRKRFEALGSEERHTQRFMLVPLSEMYAWVGLAMLSGVVGGASHDAVKKVIEKLAKQFRSRGTASLGQGSEFEAELDQLEAYIVELTTNPKAIRPDVFRPMVEEVLVDFSEEIRDEAEPHYFEKMSAVSPDSGDYRALVKIQLDAIAAAKARIGERFIPPPPIDWDDLWKNAGA
jgi:hypothetical protein